MLLLLIILKYMQKLQKLKNGDKVAIVSPSFAASAVWPHVHELGLKRIREVFELKPVINPATVKLNATLTEKAEDLIAAFSDPVFAPACVFGAADFELFAWVDDGYVTGEVAEVDPGWVWGGAWFYRCCCGAGGHYRALS
jgi:hypothetical protein